MNINDIIAEVRRLAKNNQDVIYNKCDNSSGCFYTHGEAGGKQGCIIGQAIIHLYPNSKEFFTILDNNNDFTYVTIKYLAPLLFGTTDIDNLKILWLKEVQTKQDENNTWSDAVKSADRKFPLLNSI